MVMRLLLVGDSFNMILSVDTYGASLLAHCNVLV